MNNYLGSDDSISEILQWLPKEFLRRRAFKREYLKKITARELDAYTLDKVLFLHQVDNDVYELLTLYVGTNSPDGHKNVYLVIIVFQPMVEIQVNVLPSMIDKSFLENPSSSSFSAREMLLLRPYCE